MGGGLEPGVIVQQAAVREAAEETGLEDLPVGEPVWTRNHTFRYDGCEEEVYEDWPLHRGINFRPAPAALTEYERSTIVGFHWWSIQD